MSVPLIRTLARVAFSFDPAAHRQKVGLLERLARSTIRSARGLLQYHEIVCFLQAYPDSSQVLDAVEVELARFHRRAAPFRVRLGGSGVAGTSLTYPFGFPMARWLASRFPRDVEVAWRGFARAEDLDEALALALGAPENDALGEGGPGWRRWLDLAKSGRPLSDLAVLIERFQAATMPEAVRDRLFESLGLSLRWRLRQTSRSTSKLTWGRPSYQTRPLARRPTGFLGLVTRPLTVRRLGRDSAEPMLEAFRRALALRLRELYALSYANPRDVWTADVERGLRVVLVGVRRAYRLPIESLYAFFLVKNGVPIGYGSGTVLFKVVEIATNIFPTFRPGESAWTFGQVLRVFRSVFGATEFVTDRYQLGFDNEEALRSGAVYFYHRLGFRSRNPDVRRVLRRELARRRRIPTHRTPLPILRQLALDELTLRLPGASAPDERIRAHRLGVRLTEQIAREFGGDARKARRAAARRVASAVGTPAAESTMPLAPVLALVPDLPDWPVSARRALRSVVRARGRLDTEIPYARLLARHARLRRRLARLCG
jgi:hypothetical protein